jgi:hypothetical protein
VPAYGLVNTSHVIKGCECPLSRRTRGWAGDVRLDIYVGTSTAFLDDIPPLWLGLGFRWSIFFSALWRDPNCIVISLRGYLISTLFVVA